MTRRPILNNLLARPDEDNPGLLASRCAECGGMAFPARTQCPYCLASAHEIVLSGVGEVFSYTIVNVAIPPYAGPVPYVVALVSLAEGVQVRSVIQDCEPRDVRIGLPVKVAVREVAKDDDGNVLVSYAFKPATPRDS